MLHISASLKSQSQSLHQTLFLPQAAGRNVEVEVVKKGGSNVCGL